MIQKENVSWETKTFWVIRSQFICIPHRLRERECWVEKIRENCPSIVVKILDLGLLNEWTIYSWKFECWECCISN